MVALTSKSALWCVLKICTYLTVLGLLMLALAAVHLKLDYCDSSLLNPPSFPTNPLQLVLNSTACAVTKTSKFHHITPVLKPLH
jgi:hypothetical protein